jgi:DNA polymerase-3 subunit beta
VRRFFERAPAGKDDLLGALNLTQGVVERKTTIPILSHLLCEAKGNSVTLTATDLELSIRTSCEALVSGSRSIC